MGGVIPSTIIIGWLTPVVTKHLPLLVGKIYGVSLLPYLWLFIVAASVAEYKDAILPVLRHYWWIFILLLFVVRYFIGCDVETGSYPLVDSLLLFAGITGFAYSFPQLNLKTDISYGVYIYHMTIVNALIALGFSGQGWTMWCVIAITCLLAWLSTITVGRMSAKKKTPNNC